MDVLTDLIDLRWLDIVDLSGADLSLGIYVYPNRLIGKVLEKERC